MEKINLFIDRFWISPYAFSSFVALTELKMPFHITEIALDRQENESEDYNRLSFTGRVPTLQIGDFSLSESSAIAEWLEDQRSCRESLFPPDPREKAIARMVMAWLRSDLDHLRRERPTTTMFYEKAREPLSDQAKEDVARLMTFSGRIIANKTSIFRSWALVDAELSFMLHRLIINGEPVPQNIQRYAEENWRRPSVKSFVERERPLYTAY